VLNTFEGITMGYKCMYSPI